jgi:aspartate-semialdehyde dehydrogenase
MSLPSTSSLTVAVLGATGLVGSLILELLQQRNFPLTELRPLASGRSVGKTITFNGQSIPVRLAEPEAFVGVDIVLSSAGGTVSAQLVPEAVKRGAVVIDNTSFFRLSEEVPLVVAGVNDADLAHHQGIIANPNCSTAQLMPVLRALHDAAGLQRVIISTYQSVSGAGVAGLTELLAQTQGDVEHVHLGQPNPNPEVSVPASKFSRPIAFNLIPQIDSFNTTHPLEQGYTNEELKLVHETRKILSLPHLPITATAVRVPVWVGHSEAVTVDLQRPLSVEEATAVLQAAPHCQVSTSYDTFYTPRETAGTDPVYVSRLRRDTSNPETGLNFWVVADNLRIGAALNAVRLAETLLAQGHLVRYQQERSAALVETV